METWQKNFRAVWSANFVTAAGMTTFLPLFPLHLHEIGIEDVRAVKLWSGALVAAAPLTAAVMGPVWGALGDRVGRKPMLVRANAAIALFVGLMWLVSDPWLLLLLRLLQGTFSGFIAPAMTLVSVSAPAERQGRVAGLLHTAVLAGTIVGPTMGGFVGDHFGHRHAFLLCSALSLCALLLVALWVREDPATRRARDAADGKGLLALLRHSVADARSFLAPGPMRSMVAGVFVVRGGTVLVDPVLAIFVGSLAGAAQERLGIATGIAFGAGAVATLLVTPVWGRIGDERGHARLLARCATLAALFLGAQALCGHVVQLWALRFASGVFFAGILPSAYGLAARLSPIDRRGAATGFMFSAIGLAHAVGPLAGGALAAVVGVRALMVVAAAVVLAGALALHAKRRSLADSPAGSSVAWEEVEP